jgi:acyl carrier protein
LLVPAMVPSVVVALDAFPLLPGGKIDVRALPAPDWSGAGEEEYVAPADDVEAIVQRVFAEVLGRPAEELSVLADFYSAGGTSLQVFRVVALLAEETGMHVPASDFVAAPTARQVSAIIKKKQSLAGALDLDIVHAKDWTDSKRPVSSGQESLYMAFLLNPASLEVRLSFFRNLSSFEIKRL